MKASVHLVNTITAAIGHMRRTEDFDWDHRIAARVLAVIEEHESCEACRDVVSSPAGGAS